MSGPFLPGATDEHRAAVIALSLMAVEYQAEITVIPALRTNEPTQSFDGWQCRMCKAVTKGIELLAIHANHTDTCPVKLAFGLQLAPELERAASYVGGNGRPSTWANMLAGILYRARQEEVEPEPEPAPADEEFPPLPF